MKRLVLASLAIGLAMAATAQTDSTASERSDTIKIGGIIIVKKRNPNDSAHDRNVDVQVRNRERRKPSNVSTNWGIVDLGFANYSDNTAYGSAAVQQIFPGAAGKDDLELRTGKSVNVNVWFFMQRLNLIKHAVNLKYGLGLELNNYRYDRDLQFQNAMLYVRRSNKS